MDPLKASIVKAWDHGVEDYDALVAHGRLTHTEADAWKAALAHYLPPPPGNVLEVGAGTGAMSLLIAELGYRLTAIDLSRAMLQEAQRKAAERRLEITFEIADAEVLPFAEGRFDALFGRHILWTLPDPERALREWRRVLKPGGRLVLIDSIAAPPSLQRRLKRMASDVLVAVRRPRGRAHRYGADVVAALPLAGNHDPDRYIDLIRRAGFQLQGAETLDELKALELKAMPLHERWHAEDRKYVFTALRG
jgi:ubiquinone/menaquinone biosynthesis C-methylase UbiE